MPRAHCALAKLGLKRLVAIVMSALNILRLRLRLSLSLGSVDLEGCAVRFVASPPKKRTAYLGQLAMGEAAM